MIRHGHRLNKPDTNGIMVCPESGYRYKEFERGVLRCLDLGEEEPLPPEQTVGTVSYSELKRKNK
jgi:UDP-2-acetamido-3-amino-2,3-dideoxy-glucuronate N-acetyltransferase